MENINLTIPIIALGTLVGYKASGGKIGGAFAGGIATIAILVYYDLKAAGKIGDFKEKEEETIVPEYIVLKDEEENG